MATRYNNIVRGNGAPMGVESVSRLGASLDDLETAQQLRHRGGGAHRDALVPIASGVVEYDSASGIYIPHEQYGTKSVVGTRITPINPFGRPFGGCIATPIDGFGMPTFGLSSSLGQWYAVWVAFHSPLRFRAYRSGSNQILTDSTDTKVEFQVEDYDLGAGYDNASGYDFTAPSDGLYDFEAVVHVQDQQGSGAAMLDAYAMFYIDGSEAERFSISTIPSGIGNGVALLSLTRRLDAGQTVDVRVYIKGSDTPGSKVLFGSNLSWFSGRKQQSLVDVSFSYEVFVG